jgi:SAM-dependent methyltransferase
MSEGFRHGHYVLGIEGLALLRAGASRKLDRLEDRVHDLHEVLESLDEPPYSRRRDLPEYAVDAGYSAWADSYDDPGNDTVALEEPVVRRLLDELPPGPVLDAACGTGRHAAYLVAAGREVIGVDSSEPMLARARAKLPGADLRVGQLAALPLADGAVTGAVCALALSHLPELGPAVAELARVLRPGGRLVVSNPHPFATGVLGWRAVFVDDEGARSMIPEHAHLPCDYLEAFAAAGLLARRCFEPALTREQARARAKDGQADAFEDALTGVPAVIVWEAERA